VNAHREAEMESIFSASLTTLMSKKIKNVKPLFLTAEKIKKIKKDDALFYYSLSFGSVILCGK